MRPLRKSIEKITSQPDRIQQTEQGIEHKIIHRVIRLPDGTIAERTE